jgi:hypothetical protein
VSSVDPPDPSSLRGTLFNVWGPYGGPEGNQLPPYGLDPDTGRPYDSERFRCVYTLIVHVGPKPVEMMLDAVAVSTRWIDEMGQPYLEPGSVVMTSYDEQQLHAAFERIVAQCFGSTWTEVARNLDKRFPVEELQDLDGLLRQLE